MSMRYWLLGLLAAFAIAYALWNAGAEKRAIARMPPAERQAAYRSARQALERLCGGVVPEELQRSCGDQASLLALFPECDASCHALTYPLSHRGSLR
jgi:hypothetical protein